MSNLCRIVQNIHFIQHQKKHYDCIFPGNEKTSNKRESLQDYCLIKLLETEDLPSPSLIIYKPEAKFRVSTMVCCFTTPL